MPRFAEALLDWYDRAGRKDLPWQRGPAGARDPYAVWVSEIMLQQTQVAAVIPYFERFLARFPTIAALAQSDIDEVLHHWTGLGYYARARNLHRAARAIVERHGGAFPRDLDAVCALPGIGASTAGAILAFAHNQHHAILDGNVKRVLARYHRMPGWPGKKDVEHRLWDLARSHTPKERVADYNQAIMDLGATVCRRSPACERCPVQNGCAAFAAGDAPAYPAPPPRKTLPVRATLMLMIDNGEGGVLLERRPPAGVWGGLWGFPECDPGADPVDHCRARLGLAIAPQPAWPGLRHTFSHFHLDIVPVPARLSGADRLMENTDAVWYNLHLPEARGLAAPVKRLLEQLRRG